MILTFGSLFSGIGGLDLGLERAGMRCLWQSEIDPYASAVLKKHWPEVPNLGDIRAITDAPAVDLICGGFPCQDVSNAGNRAGIRGERTGLFFELLRIVRLVRPRGVLLENVPGLAVGDGLPTVLGELAAVGFDAEWSTVSSCSLGATHTRQRLFVVAHSNGVDGWPRIRYSDARPDWTLSAVGGFEGARARALSRMANPSELYRGADGVRFGMDRNRTVGNSVDPAVAEAIGRMIVAAVQPP